MGLGSIFDIAGGAGDALQGYAQIGITKQATDIAQQVANEKIARQRAKDQQDAEKNELDMKLKRRTLSEPLPETPTARTTREISERTSNAQHMTFANPAERARYIYANIAPPTPPGPKVDLLKTPGKRPGFLKYNDDGTTSYVEATDAPVEPLPKKDQPGGGTGVKLSPAASYRQSILPIMKVQYPGRSDAEWAQWIGDGKSPQVRTQELIKDPDLKRDIHATDEVIDLIPQVRESIKNVIKGVSTQLPKHTLPGFGLSQADFMEMADQDEKGAMNGGSAWLNAHDGGRSRLMNKLYDLGLDFAPEYEKYIQRIAMLQAIGVQPFLKGRLNQNYISLVLRHLPDPNQVPTRALRALDEYAKIIYGIRRTKLGEARLSEQEWDRARKPGAVGGDMVDPSGEQVQDEPVGRGD